MLSQKSCKYHVVLTCTDNKTRYTATIVPETWLDTRRHTLYYPNNTINKGGIKSKIISGCQPDRDKWDLYGYIPRAIFSSFEEANNAVSKFDDINITIFSSFDSVTPPPADIKPEQSMQIGNINDLLDNQIPTSVTENNNGPLEYSTYEFDPILNELHDINSKIDNLISDVNDLKKRTEKMESKIDLKFNSLQKYIGDAFTRLSTLIEHNQKSINNRSVPLIPINKPIVASSSSMENPESSAFDEYEVEMFKELCETHEDLINFDTNKAKDKDIIESYTKYFRGRFSDNKYESREDKTHILLLEITHSIISRQLLVNYTWSGFTSKEKSTFTKPFQDFKNILIFFHTIMIDFVSDFKLDEAEKIFKEYILRNRRSHASYAGKRARCSHKFAARSKRKKDKQDDEDVKEVKEENEI